MPLAVAQSLTEYRFGDPDVSLPLFTATGATGTVHWATSSGGLTNASGATTELNPLDRSLMVTVTANDNLATVEKTVQIWATLPYQPKWGVEVDVSPPTVRWPMAHEKRSFDEYWTMMQFFKFHQKAVIETSEAEDGNLSIRVVRGIPFYVDDIASGVLAKVYFDSAIRISAQGADWLDYAYQLVSFEYEIQDNPTAGPFIPGGALLLEGGGHVLLED